MADDLVLTQAAGDPEPCPEAEGYFFFAFELSDKPDDPWRDAFEQLAGDPTRPNDLVAATVRGETIRLFCAPADLKTEFERLRKLVRAVNEQWREATQASGNAGAQSLSDAKAAMAALRFDAAPEAPPAPAPAPSAPAPEPAPPAPDTPPETSDEDTPPSAPAEEDKDAS